MRISFLASLASLTLTVALAVPVAVKAHDGDKPVHRHHTAHHRTIHPLAFAQVPASVGLAALPIYLATPLGSAVLEEPDAWQGLGRNPDDCAKYGCVDSGGE